MNYSFEYIDIILLAMIAGFIFLRLRGILGKRTGFDGKLSTDFNEDFSNDVVKEKLEIEGERARLMRLAEVTISVEEEKNAKLEQIKKEFDARIQTIDDGVRAAKEAKDKAELQQEQALQDQKRAIIGRKTPQRLH